MELDHTARPHENDNAQPASLPMKKAARLLQNGFRSIPWRRLALLGILGLAAYGAAMNPPIKPVAKGEVGLRINQWTGNFTPFQDELALVVPLIHEFHTYPLRDWIYQPGSDGGSVFSFPSAEGLPLDAEFTARYALDMERLAAVVRNLPEDIDNEIALPIIQEVIHKMLSRYTVREIFTSSRQEIQDALARELQARLTEEGVQLKSLVLDKISLPADLLRDRIYHPGGNGENGFSFQSTEGLTLGAELTARYALDMDRLPATVPSRPEDIDSEIALPAIHDILHKTFSRYTVREIFSSRRQEIQDEIHKELHTRLGDEGIKLKSFTLGKINLPPDYLRGMEKMLEAELAAEQMKYTLELKEKEVKESELRAEAEKVSREKAAEAAAQEQVIAAQAQAEAMKHILPFKEKQIKQRELEAEADKQARIKRAQANAEARVIEAAAEADSRRKLADAEVYRLDQVGKVNSEQMAREGAIITRNPLLIQKTLAEKLSDKVQVIVAPPGTNGRFIGENLVGRIPSDPMDH